MWGCKLGVERPGGGKKCGWRWGTTGQKVTGECNEAVTVLRVRNEESKRGASAELSLARSNLQMFPNYMGG
eukprot:3212296-Rhodomonas_salina.1